MQHFRQHSSNMSALQHQSLKQGRAGQGRAGQGRAGQVRAGQGRAGQGRAGQVVCMHEHVTLTQSIVHTSGSEGVTITALPNFQCSARGEVCIR